MSNETNLFPTDSTRSEADTTASAAPKPSAVRRRTIFDDVVIHHFRTAATSSVGYLNRDIGIALTPAGFHHLQAYFSRTVRRDPTAGELRLLDAVSRIPAEGSIGHRYVLTEMITDSEAIAEAWADMTDKHTRLRRAAEGTLVPCTWEDALHLTERYLRRIGRFGDRKKPKPFSRKYAVLTSSAQMFEALAAGYTPVARMQTDDGTFLTVVCRMGAPLQETPPRAGDTLIYCPAVSREALEDLMMTRRHMSTPDIGALRVVTRKSLLHTALELSGGLDLHAYRLPSEKTAPGGRYLPLDTLCLTPSEIGDTVGLLIRTPLGRTQYVGTDLMRRGLSPIALGQVIRDEQVILRLHAPKPKQDQPVVRLHTLLLQDMEAVAARTYRPTVREDIRAEVRIPALVRLPGMSPYEHGALASEQEVIPPTTCMGIPEEHLLLEVATAHVTVSGTGYAAAMAAVAKAMDAIQGLKATPSLSVSLRVRGGIGHLTAEVICGLYRAAAERGLPILNPDLTVYDRRAEPAVHITVIAYATDPSKHAAPPPPPSIPFPDA